MRFDAAIFDCDGVLVQTGQLGNRALQGVLRSYGIDCTLAETIRLAKGRSNGALKAELEFAYRVQLPDRFIREIELAERRILDTDSLRTVPGARSVLRHCQRIGLPFAVASNGELAKMKLTLGRTALLGLFGGRVFSAEMVVNPKPAPDIYLLAAAKLNVKPERCLVVEDSLPGAAAGLAAGMTVFYLAARNEPDSVPVEFHKVHRLTDLLPHIG